ncbi:hypothetical protein Avbf_10329 [Armadillidium vulgare]|nr:hypothetical protein Avbf_10329 [Armadillidium vulgare]
MISFFLAFSLLALITIKLIKNLTEKSEAIDSGFILPILPTKSINTVIVGWLKKFTFTGWFSLMNIR